MTTTYSGNRPTIEIIAGFKLRHTGHEVRNTVDQAFGTR